MEEMEELEYGELELKFPPLFHIVSLIWRHSRHYQQPARLVVILQEISNLVIELVPSFLANQTNPLNDCLYRHATT